MRETIVDHIGNEAVIDREATVRAYEQLAHGSTDTCECLYCANYRAQRNRQMFPAELLSICDRVGIDILKEGETTFYHRTPSGLCIYGSEMPLVGIVNAHESLNCVLSKGWAFKQLSGPLPPEAFGTTVGIVEYYLQLPWVLAEEPDWIIPAQ